MKLLDFENSPMTSEASTSGLLGSARRGRQTRCAPETVALRRVLVTALLALLLSGPSARVRAGGLARVEFSAFSEHRPVTVNPAAPSAPLPLRLEDIPNADWVIRRLGLDPAARQALERNGFVVVPNGTENDMLAVYTNSISQGMPNFITSDSLLHLYHIQFEEILRSLEEKEFFPALIILTRSLQADALAQYHSLAGDLREAARRNAAFLTVAYRALDRDIAIPEMVQSEVTRELALIEKHAGFAPSPIFIYDEDYSQYVPRGHYTRSETLKRYFKAMLWYGRMTCLLKGNDSFGPGGDALISVAEARIQTFQAALLTLGLDRVEAEGRPIAEIWNRIYSVTAFFVGLADDLTPIEYKEAIQRVYGAAVSAPTLDNEAKFLLLKIELAKYQQPKIFGGTGNAMVPPNATAEDLQKVLDKAKGLRVMGQRFIPDSYMFQNLVLPMVQQYTGNGQPFTWGRTEMGPRRVFPRGLDVMTVLGSEAALGILDREGDTDYLDYDKTLNVLIAQFRSFRPADWMRNLYWAWLYSFEPLLAPCGDGYPAFMQTMAWRDKQLHTALASWAELRHDTILYAKQSYTSGVTSVPEPPPPPDRGYVEPVPEFYNRLLSLARLTRSGLTALNALDAPQADRLSLLETVLSRLVVISLAELEGRVLSADDYRFIERFGLDLQPLQSGLADDQATQTTLIADVHTDSNSSLVLEEGVGYLKLLVAAYRLAEGRTVLGAGPVFSYYEFKWPLSDRLTDEKWTNMLAAGTAPATPEWVHSFTHPVTLPPEDDDGDGLADAWERYNWGGTDVVNAARGDFDGDGMSNLSEFHAGTDPRDGNSRLQIAPLSLGQAGLDLRWPGVAGRRYRVFFSEDLKNWYLLKTPLVSEGGVSSLTDHEAANARTRFYRVRVVPER